MSVDFEQKFNEAKTASLLSDWAYGDKSPDNGWEIIGSVSKPDGLMAYCFLNSQSKEIWFGYAGPDQPKDVLDYPSIYGMKLSSQVENAMVFTGQMINKNQKDSQYQGYAIHAGSESWGNVLLQSCAKMYGFSAIVIDGPGAANYMHLYFYEGSMISVTEKLGSDMPSYLGDFSYTALTGTTIGAIGERLSGAITGSITILNYDKNDFYWFA